MEATVPLIGAYHSNSLKSSNSQKKTCTTFHLRQLLILVSHIKTQYLDLIMQIISLPTIFFSTFLSSSLCGHRSYSKNQPRQKSTPQSIPEIVSTNSDFSTLLAAVSAAGLVEALSAEGPFTVFAPTNNAFAKVSCEYLDYLEYLSNIDI